MGEIDPETLLPSERMRRGAVDGDVTQVHRGHAYADTGDRFEIDGTAFEVVSVAERTLGELTDADARAEGMADLDEYAAMLERVHDEFEWDDDAAVVCHRFERRDEPDQ
jgi:hypothetical protein